MATGFAKTGRASLAAVWQLMGKLPKNKVNTSSIYWGRFFGCHTNHSHNICVAHKVLLCCMIVLAGLGFLGFRLRDFRV